LAQDPVDTDQVEPPIEEIIVTGSRIKRTEFSSAVPVQVIDMEMATLAGQTDLTDILQTSNLAMNAPQVNNSTGYAHFYLGPDFGEVNGHGTNTIDLRGLGPGRTLVLLNGRRLNPAGVRGTVNAVDLNTIPSSMIERIEILKDGASSVYGSDAVSGVINIITKKSLDGASASLSHNAPFDGGGQVTSADLSFGINGDNSSFLFGIDYFERDALRLSDRDWMQCTTEFVRDPDTGEDLSMIDPTTGEPKCFTGRSHSYVTHYGDYPTTGRESRSIWDPSICEWRVIDFPERPWGEPSAGRKTIVSPVQRFSVHGFGNWALGSAAEGYFELLYNARRSDQNAGSFRLTVWQEDSPWSPFYNDDGWAYDMAVLLPFEHVPKQDVDWLRGVLGFTGELQSGWSWDVNAGYGRSDGGYRRPWVLQDRLDDMTDLVEVAPGQYDCAVNLEPNASGDCVPFNPYPIIQDGLNWPGAFPLDQIEYAKHTMSGTTTYDQKFLSGYLSGDLFGLPAGTVQGVFGVEGRRESINDRPDPELRAGNIWYLSPIGITKGTDTVREVFAELEFPLLRDLAFARDLTINVAGRISDYDTAGSGSTYRVGLNWQIIDQLRLRAAFGTSFRAPALYESFLKGSTSQILFDGDPCRVWDEGDPDVDPNVVQNCQNEIGDASFGVIQWTKIITLGNDGGLEPETSESLTAGLVIALDVIDLAIAIDYFEFTIENEIGNYGPGGVVWECYGLPPDLFRQPGTICDFVSERNPNYLHIEEITDSYFNVNGRWQTGFDLTMQYAFDIGAVDFVADLRATKILEYVEKLVDDFEADWSGTIGFPDVNGQLDLSARFREWTFYYGLDYIAGQSSYEAWEIDPSDSDWVLATDDVTYHDVAVGYDGNDWSVQLGVQNLADTKPPFVSMYAASHAGNAAAGPGYDLLGRRYSLTLSAEF
jgi:outer membrane receptor protein involved in Fe transport